MKGTVGWFMMTRMTEFVSTHQSTKAGQLFRLAYTSGPQQALLDLLLQTHGIIQPEWSVSKIWQELR